MTLTELKAAAYDTLANIDYLQKKLAEINKQIAEKMQEDESAKTSE